MGLTIGRSSSYAESISEIRGVSLEGERMTRRGSLSSGSLGRPYLESAGLAGGHSASTVASAQNVEDKSTRLAGP